jgi:hypothetical protein
MLSMLAPASACAQFSNLTMHKHRNMHQWFQLLFSAKEKMYLLLTILCGENKTNYFFTCLLLDMLF